MSESDNPILKAKTAVPFLHLLLNSKLVTLTQSAQTTIPPNHQNVKLGLGRSKIVRYIYIERERESV